MKLNRDSAVIVPPCGASIVAASEIACLTMQTLSAHNAPLCLAGSHRVRLATKPADVQAAQRLRFEVFNLELNQGLDSAYLSGFDADRFDECCDHLLVEEVCSGRVVGTYRLQTGQLAAAHHGYYSAQEFDFTPFEPIRCETVELGRACVHREHRKLRVLNLLWRGIAIYATERCAPYLIGCSSLTSQVASAGAASISSRSAFARCQLAITRCLWEGRPRRARPSRNCSAPTSHSAQNFAVHLRSIASSRLSIFSRCSICAPSLTPCAIISSPEG